MAQDPPASRNPVRAFFDKRAAQWDTMISAGHGTRLEQLLAPLPLDSSAQVLDVGCGTGVLLPILAQRLDERGCVVCIDLSGAMMRETRQRIRALHPRPRCLPVQADVTAAPFPEGAFDWVICNSCFPHFQDQQQALHEMARLLRPGGTLVVCHSESRDAINTLHRNVGGIVGGHELPKDDTFRKLVHGAGLTLMQMEDRHDGFLLVARREHADKAKHG
ncbi:MAG: class I SAM-dependent methyltransferase [Candidatus Hydrogenedentes bacterium]|nr:class I SAM-dependent methyltransferase [Candidatus Hydrogenedentota bacterium]